MPVATTPKKEKIKGSRSTLRRITASGNDCAMADIMAASTFRFAQPIPKNLDAFHSGNHIRLYEYVKPSLWHVEQWALADRSIFCPGQVGDKLVFERLQVRVAAAVNVSPGGLESRTFAL